MTVPSLYYIREETAEPNDGGTFTSGAWQTRTLNTEVTTEISGTSLSSNQFTLPAGTYFIQFHSPAYRVNTAQARLRNITDSTTDMLGARLYHNNSSFYGLRSSGGGLLTIGASKTFELQHRCQLTKTGDGFGAQFGSNSGETNVWSEVYVWEL